MSFPFAQIRVVLSSLVLCLTVVGLAVADHHEKTEKKESPPTPREQVRSLEAMCAENADAMAARQAEKSLHERLGGREGIREIVTEIVRLHEENEQFADFMGDVDRERLIHGVTEFLVVGGGGPGEYKGRSMPDAHAHLKLTNADFLSAGGDVMQAMRNKDCGEEEIQEVVCSLVALREQVVIESEKTLD